MNERGLPTFKSASAWLCDINPGSLLANHHSSPILPCRHVSPPVRSTWPGNHHVVSRTRTKDAVGVSGQPGPVVDQEERNACYLSTRQRHNLIEFSAQR